MFTLSTSSCSSFVISLEMKKNTLCYELHVNAKLESTAQVTKVSFSFKDLYQSMCYLLVSWL